VISTWPAGEPASRAAATSGSVHSSEAIAVPGIPMARRSPSGSIMAAKATSAFTVSRKGGKVSALGSGLGAKRPLVSRLRPSRDTPRRSASKGSNAPAAP